MFSNLYKQITRYLSIAKKKPSLALKFDNALQKKSNVTSVGIKCLEKWANNSNFSNYLKMLNHQRSPEIKMYEWNYYVWNLKQQSIVFISQKLRFIIAFQWKLDQGIFKNFSNTFLTIFNFLIFPLILSFR